MNPNLAVFKLPSILGPGSVSNLRPARVELFCATTSNVLSVPNLSAMSKIVSLSLENPNSKLIGALYLALVPSLNPVVPSPEMTCTSPVLKFRRRIE